MLPGSWIGPFVRQTVSGRHASPQARKGVLGVSKKNTLKAQAESDKQADSQTEEAVATIA